MANTAKTTRKTREQTEPRKKMQWRPPAKLDVPPAPEGYHYRWVRHELRGEDQSANVYERTRQGYEVVKADELGDFPVDQLEGGKHAGVVRSGDLILTKVPDEVVEARNEYYEGLTKRMQKSVDQELDKNDNTTMPIQREDRSQVIKGRQPDFDVDEFED